MEYNTPVTIVLKMWNVLLQDNVVEEMMTVDAKHHRYFVAKRGEVLRNIGEEFGGVVVSFPRQGVTTDKVNLYVHISFVVQMWWNHNFDTNTNEISILCGYGTDSFIHERKIDTCKLLSHRKVLNSILKVTLKGAKNCVDAARKRINSLIDDLESQVTIEIVIEQHHHRYK